jgi:hypothetical protein
MRVRTLLVAVATVCCAVSSAALANNPQYDSWAKHKPGTCVTMAGTTEAAGMKTEMEQVYTLKAVTPEKVTVEIKSAMTMMGNKNEMPAQSMDIPATAPEMKAPEGQKPPEAKTSQEKVTVAGKEYDATCTTIQSDANGMKTTAMTWASPEIPGMTLKMEAKTEGAVASTTKMEVTKVETK